MPTRLQLRKFIFKIPGLNMFDSILIRKFLLVKCHDVLWIIIIYHLQRAILSRKCAG